MSILQRRIVLMIGLAALVALAPRVALGQATPSAPATPAAAARTFALPGDQVYPEGIAYRAETNTFYVGSTTSGAIFQGDLQSGTVDTLVPGNPPPMATGMKVTPDGQLIVAGGASGGVFVVDLASGQVVRELTNGLSSDQTFLNDIAIVPGGDAYVTDSVTPILYRVPLSASASSPVAAEGTAVAAERLDEFLDFTGTPAQYTEGFNLNGIVPTPDGEYLITVQTNTGKLFRIDLASKEVTEITGLSEPLTLGDGMVLDGTTLYVVRNQMNIIAVVQLADDYASGTILGNFTEGSLAYPTTAALADGCLLLVNSQFDKQQSGNPSLPFTVSAVPIPEQFLPPGSPTPSAACGNEGDGS